MINTFRLKSIEFKDFRNIESGIVTFPNSDVESLKEEQGSILGLYGQNGSGKTSVILALNIVKAIITGEDLDEKYSSCIRSGQDMCFLSFGFSMYINPEDAEVEMDICYSFNIGKDKKKKDSLYVLNEKITSSWCVGGQKISKQVMIDTSNDMTKTPDMAFGNSSKYKLFTDNNPEVKKELVKNRYVSEALHKSFIFYRETYELLYKLNTNYVLRIVDEVLSGDKKNWGSKEIMEMSIREYFVMILQALWDWGTGGLVIVNTADNGSNVDSGIMPLHIWYSYKDLLPCFDDEDKNMFEEKIENAKKYNMDPNILDKKGFNSIYPLDVEEINEIIESDYVFVKKRIKAISNAINAIVPNVCLEIKDYGTRLNKDGEEVHEFELLSKRGDVLIPLRYESDGIRKIISILFPLILAFNNPSYTVAIDEIDSGIFEYLLGEILSVMQDSARGQLIFTSHNLRPLEVLDAKNLTFTTTNPENRFTKFSKRGNSNMRDSYFRNIVLGTSKDSIYNPTDRYYIELAFMEAGMTDEE